LPKVKGSDLYVLILGGRYGWQPEVKESIREGESGKGSEIIKVHTHRSMKNRICFVKTFTNFGAWKCLIVSRNV